MTLRHLVLVACLAALPGCRPAEPPDDSLAESPPPVGADAPSGPIVILISIDGTRWDALDAEWAPALSAMAGRGVRAEALIPSFPSDPWPNDYTLVTGLYPEHHGIVSHTMVDPGTGARFRVASSAVADSAWWGGEPVWVTAEKHGLRSAAVFWPGSEAEVGGLRPSYWLPFDDDVTADERVSQVLDWLALPGEQRPSFVAVSLGDVDHAGHRYGPDALETHEALSYDDAAVGELVSGVARLGLDAVTTFVVISAHGMTAISPDRMIYVDDFLDLSQVDVLSWTPNLEVVPRPGVEAAVYDAVRDGHPALRVYRRSELPESLHYRDNPRIAPIVGMAEEGWTVATRDPLASMLAAGPISRGTHGYDPTRFTSMRGFFIAAGPGLREGLTVPAFETIHVYDLLCRLLGIAAAPNDGDPAVTAGLLAPG